MIISKPQWQTLNKLQYIHHLLPSHGQIYVSLFLIFFWQRGCYSHWRASTVYRKWKTDKIKDFTSRSVWIFKSKSKYLLVKYFTVSTCIFFAWVQLGIINMTYFQTKLQPHSSWIRRNWPHPYTGRFIMFSVIINIYNKKTKGPSLMELFTATGKLKSFFWQLEIFDVCTIGDTAHIFKLLPRMRQLMLTHVWQQLEYRIDVCRVTRGVHIEHL